MGFKHFLSTSISSVVKSPESLKSTPGTVWMSFTSDHDLSCEILIMHGNLPLLISCSVREFAKNGAWCLFTCLASEPVDDLPGSSARVSEVD